MQQDNEKDSCWGKIAAFTEIIHQADKLTDRLHEAISMQTEITRAQSEILKELQAMKLLPYIETRMRAIEAQQQHQGAA